MRLLSYTNREIVAEARALLGDPCASEERCKEFVRTFIRTYVPGWQPGDELTRQQYEQLGFWWNQAREKYDE